ncbi:NAD(P)-binding protein [Pholiota conissans]|uniref:NAD(P)-binding protein n=1 Tax=Pholiota conissans TaxID=109636 RepID=A0A9P6CUW7_9AGAR|nr:NAD(P)-binding protein [Pholiota conissans]
MAKENGVKTPEVFRTKLMPRQIPTVAYTVQNILISIASIISSIASFLFTLWIILPLSMIRAVIPANMLQSINSEGKNKVVLIVGASRGIGFSVLKQYADDPDTVIIAASRSIESLRKAVIELGDTLAIIQCAELDLTAQKKQIAENVRAIDKSYGPITHLYEVSGISNHLKEGTPWGLNVTDEMINVNISGTVASILTTYELMKERGYGKICIVGSVAGLYGPANMISYASTKAFINTFSASLRILAAPCGVEVVTVQPGFIDTRMTKKMRGQDSTVPNKEFASPHGMAAYMKQAVEQGGVGVVSWPVRQSVMMHALQSVNPICEELGQWISMKMMLSGKKIT